MSARMRLAVHAERKKEKRKKYMILMEKLESGCGSDHIFN
jgi:hypothetical protein